MSFIFNSKLLWNGQMWWTQAYGFHWGISLKSKNGREWYCYIHPPWFIPGQILEIEIEEG